MFSPTKKIHPLTFERILLNIYGKQRMDVSTVKWWVMRFNSGNSFVFEEAILTSPSQLSAHVMKMISFMWIGGLQPGQCVRIRMAFHCYWNEVSNVDISQILCQYVSWIIMQKTKEHWITMRLKLTVYRIASSMATRCNVITMSWNKKKRRSI